MAARAETDEDKKKAEDARLATEKAKADEEAKKKTEDSSNKGDTDPNKSGGGDANKSGGKKVITISEEDLQKKMDELAGKIRSEEKSKSEKAKIEADSKAAKDKLEADQKWKELYELQKTELEKVKEKAATSDELSLVVHQMIDTEIKDWPAELKALDPGKEVSTEARKKWVETSRPLAIRLLGDKKAPDTEHGKKSAADKQGVPSGKEVVQNYQRSRYTIPLPKADEKKT